MAKTKQDKADERVESAIRTLFQKFEAPSRYGCSRARSKEVAALEKKIKKREEEIAKDAELKSLKSELKEVQKRSHEAAKELHERVNGLLRRFQLRGVSDELLNDIEALSNEKPVLIGDDCE